MWSHFKQQVQQKVEELERQIAVLKTKVGLKDDAFTATLDKLTGKLKVFKITLKERQEYRESVARQVLDAGVIDRVVAEAVAPKHNAFEDAGADEDDHDEDAEADEDIHDEDAGADEDEDEDAEADVALHGADEPQVHPAAQVMDSSDAEHHQGLLQILQDELHALVGKDGDNNEAYRTLLEDYLPQLKNLMKAFEETWALDLPYDSDSSHGFFVAAQAEFLETHYSYAARHRNDSNIQLLRAYLRNEANAAAKVTIAKSAAERMHAIYSLLTPALKGGGDAAETGYADFERQDAVLYQGPTGQVKAYQGFRYLIQAVSASVVITNTDLVTARYSRLPAVAAKYLDNGQLQAIAAEQHKSITARSKEADACPKGDENTSFFKHRLSKLLKTRIQMFIANNPALFASGKQSQCKVTTQDVDKKFERLFRTDISEGELKDSFCQYLATTSGKEANVSYQNFLNSLREEVLSLHRYYKDYNLLGITIHDGTKAVGAGFAARLIDYLLECEYVPKITGKGPSDRGLRDQKLQFCKDTLNLLRDVTNLLNNKVPCVAEREAIFQRVMQRMVLQLDLEHRPKLVPFTGKFGPIIERLVADSSRRVREFDARARRAHQQQLALG